MRRLHAFVRRPRGGTEAARSTLGDGDPTASSGSVRDSALLAGPLHAEDAHHTGCALNRVYDFRLRCGRLGDLADHAAASSLLNTSASPRKALINDQCFGLGLTILEVQTADPGRGRVPVPADGRRRHPGIAWPFGRALEHPVVDWRRCPGWELG